jgi:hypothetical protein
MAGAVMWAGVSGMEREERKVGVYIPLVRSPFWESLSVETCRVTCSSAKLELCFLDGKHMGGEDGWSELGGLKC